MATAAASIFIWYEKSRLRRARVKPEKYTPVISLYLRSIRTPSPPSRFIRLFLFGKTRRFLCRAFSHDPTCDFLSRGEKRRRFLYARRKIPFIFASRIRRGAFECRQRNILMPVGTMKARFTNGNGVPDFNKGNRSTHVQSPLRIFCLPSKGPNMKNTTYSFRESQSVEGR